MTRREFFGRCKQHAFRLAHWLGILGFQYKPYTFTNGIWSGWIEWFGRCVGFVSVRGTIHWLK